MLNILSYDIVRIDRDFPLLKCIDCNGVEILADAEFRKSVAEVCNLTLLDTDRLANLWSLCQMSDPEGDIIEVGSYKGGGAMHLSNSCPNKKIYVFDSFSGFKKVDPVIDNKFEMDQFVDTTEIDVRNMFINKNRNASVVPGFFPDSAEGVNLKNISFAHIDVDTYDATVATLDFILRNSLMMEKSFIIVDDFRRGCSGVDKALLEIGQLYKNWCIFPLFPSQALLLPIGWYD